jgi:signal peptidase I
MMNYIGPSMNPILRTGDGLRVIPYRNRKICVGDVVVFRPPNREHNVVHRVISVDSQGVRTSGDNSNRIDPWVLAPNDIIGRVVSAQRENRNVTIHGGTQGRIFASALWALKRVKLRINSMVSRILHPAYHYLAQSGICRKMLSNRVKTQILCFRRKSGMEMQLLIGRWVIGRRLPGRDQWQIRRPFRLFVDESSLPIGINLSIFPVSPPSTGGA